MKYPLGIQTFANIRNENYVYVDKTNHIYDLVTSGKHYFLSRPRRFGKSLLISTLQAVFLGEKSLFNGLAINQTDYDFTVYPVIKFEFSNVQVTVENDLKSYIINTVNYFAKQYDITLSIDSYEQRFIELVRELHTKTGKPVVLLVDEYDKPILDNLFSEHLSAIRTVMGGFYACAKQLDEHLRFVFITGVSKFAKVSVFSCMNNLTDISMEQQFATICGVTQQELEDNFAQPLSKLAQNGQVTLATLLAQIKHWYNGYQFHQHATGIYNPYSLLSLLRKSEFDNYWFETGTPTFLLDVLQNKQYDLQNLTQREVGRAAFKACEPENMGVQSLFLQTGYLTIKSVKDDMYKLGFPNLEVEKSFYDSVTSRYSYLDAGEEQSYIYQLTNHLKAKRFEQFFDTLSAFFANIPYDIQLKLEVYYQSLFYAIFKLIGLNIKTEVRTNKGRIDCVIETDDMICIIEFKLNDSKEAALQQILDTQYIQKYQQSKKQKVLIGVEFSQDSRNIEGYLIESRN